MNPFFSSFAALCLLCGPLGAADTPQSNSIGTRQLPAEVPSPALPPPTLVNVQYGEYDRQVLDFWRADSPHPTPVLLYIPGGGWVANGKEDAVNVGIEKYLAAGISVVCINYRYVTEAIIAGAAPPVQWPLEDAARALQFVRSKAGEWKVDKGRIGAWGGSAGGCSSLWLAFHADLADPESSDPVARESTRLWCVAATGAQTTLDPQQMKAWTPNSVYGGHAFGFMSDPRDLKTRDGQFAQFLAARDKIRSWIVEYSPLEHVTADDPPIYLSYRGPPGRGQPQGNPTHTSNFGAMLAEKLQAAGVEYEFVYSEAANGTYPPVVDFLIQELKAPARDSARRTRP